MTANLSLKERLKQRFQKFRQSGAGVLFKSNARYGGGGYREALRSPPPPTPNTRYWGGGYREALSSPPPHLIPGMGAADTGRP